MNYYLQFVYNSDNIMLKVLNYDNNGVHKKKNLLFNNHYDNKLSNNIIRGRSKILDYCYNNDFKYFLTATISSNYDRSDLNSFIKRFTQTIRDIRKQYSSDLFYIIIPELHADKKNWHIHGLIGGSCIEYDKYKNKFGYYSLKSFDKLGFNSISEIKSKDACNIYITKYITKSLGYSRKKNEHLFYTSRYLQTGVKLPLIKVDSLLLNDFDFDYSSLNIKLKKFFDCKNVTEILQNYDENNNLINLIDNLKSL